MDDSHAPDRHFATEAIRTQVPRARREHSAPMYLTSSFIFESAEQGRALFAGDEEGEIYSRFINPNVQEFEQKMAKLEGLPRAYATSTGMAAIFASMATFLAAGDHIVSSRAVFGSTHSLLTKFLPRWGIEHTYVDLEDHDGWEQAIQPNTKMIFVETPSNPGLALADMAHIGQLAEAYGLLFNVDNCFATPYLQQPVQYGAHLVTHSATKFIDGQGRVLGGVVAGSDELIHEVYLFCRNTGPSLSPFNAWVLSKSLETLHVRMEAHCTNAHQLAEELEGHPELEWVRYPFLPSHPQHQLAKAQMKRGGGILTLNLTGGYERAKRFLDALQMLSISANLGDTRSIATHPASTTHSKLSDEERAAVGITPGLVRVSVGLESLPDIRGDIEQALEQSRS